MFEFFEGISLREWIDKLSGIGHYLLSKWYLLILACLTGAGIGYVPNRNLRPAYTATISFVLYTEPARGNNGIAGLAAQLGLDAGTSGAENVFSGDNIIELFKSRKMVRKALFSEVSPSTHQNLLNYIAVKQYSKDILPFPSSPDKFSLKQQAVFRIISDSVANSFTVFKKDKKLIFYYISATASDPNIAYYTAKCMLDQTSQFFIETKTSAAIRGLKLLKKEADSLAILLSGNSRASASIADRTYNMNPSLMVQRSGAQLNQAKGMALSAAYTEVMRNLEVAKINVEKETPLFGIIDEPDLPLPPQMMNVKKHVIITSLIALALMVFILAAYSLYLTTVSPLNLKNAGK